MNTQPTDTSAEAELVQLRILRQASPARRGMLACSLSRSILTGSRLAIQRRNPQQPPAEIIRQSLVINYGIADESPLRNRYVAQEHIMLSPDMIQALVPVIELFEQLGIAYHIGGSLASSIHGIPRVTLDADVVARIEDKHIL
ncbi:MAG TPA: hypothetical protein VGE07_31395, partial [Herpetosiphonaceae bacterium]